MKHTSPTRAPLPLLVAVVSLLAAVSVSCTRTETTRTNDATAQTNAAQQANNSAAATGTNAAPVEAAPAPTATGATAAPDASPPAPDLTPPAPSEVRAAVARIYQSDVAIDPAQASQTVVGDFNGDGSADLAVVVAPAADKLADLNSEVANWILGDPQKIVLPDVKPNPHGGMAGGVLRRPDTEERPKIEAGDTLLVVIHGFEARGWRNPAARQTYLLKNAVGTDLHTEPRKEVLQEMATRAKRPLIRGDVIRQRLNAQSGFLYWNGATYGWFR